MSCPLPHWLSGDLRIWGDALITRLGYPNRKNDVRNQTSADIMDRTDKKKGPSIIRAIRIIRGPIINQLLHKLSVD
jgi:hypothetical protein